MTVRRSRLTLLGAALALIAMIGLSALSGWHSAFVHDHAPAHASSVEHSHGTSGRTDPDGPIHVMAHATGQWLAPAGQPLVPVLMPVARAAWTIAASAIATNFAPSELLRPPRG